MAGDLWAKRAGVPAEGDRYRLATHRASRRHVLATGLLALSCACRTQAVSAECLGGSDLKALPPVTFSPEQEEMHGIHLLLAMALVFDGWGVDRRRPERVAAYAAAEPGRQFADYAGHNVGALLVDRNGRILCFALNRNVELNSTLEHAEARTVREAIKSANALKGPQAANSWTFSDLLRDARLYATLEPCAQCAGIADLANIGTVVYGQRDPIQFDILNVLFNLKHRPGEADAPLPVRATFLPLWDEIAAAYTAFVAAAAPGSQTGTTAFLETLEAYGIFRRAAASFAAITARHAVNAPLLREAQSFRARWRGKVGLGLVPVE